RHHPVLGAPRRHRGQQLRIDLAHDPVGARGQISQKTLTRTLRSLEHHGLLTRTVAPTVPVTVTYELTELGLSLHHMTRGLRAWAQTHMAEVLAHREISDAHAS
ncbi:helix-turn-helix domain-containing protein, partial [Streptomyces sp. NPDC007162]|uniref:winged helix-turn-helix transcriptional regulator n=1 Tax=Streptomyces sp. NPDC007162 TaxID=3156917 RepID=UPI0033CB8663